MCRSYAPRTSARARSVGSGAIEATVFTVAARLLTISARWARIGGAAMAADHGSFPNPYEIEKPAGCEGREEMDPYYALFDERRRERGDLRFWVWNSVHFPVPLPAFDVFCIDSPYDGIGSWQNRVFAVPPAMGIDYRCVNGYIYISGNAVTDPEKIAERAGYFQQRAGYYFEHWDELYGKWRGEGEGGVKEEDEREGAGPPEGQAERGGGRDEKPPHHRVAP